MPIKYNLTKNDILAAKFHQITQKEHDEFSDDDALFKAAATLIASFSSSHSWQTYKSLTDRDGEKLRSKEVKDEYELAVKERWKAVTAADIEEVARLSVNPTLFSIWLTFNAEREQKDLYRSAWNVLNTEFQKECDMKVETAR